MKCKYFDCGWCYAPIDVVTSASSCGSCVYPEHCPYLKTEMTDKQPEVMSSGTAIISDENGVPTKVHLSDKEKLTEMTKKQSKENTTYITTGFGHPIDADAVIINGVEYRKTVKSDTKPKDKTLYDICVEWNDDDDNPPVSDLIDSIEQFLPNPQSAEGSQNAYVESAVEGFNDCLQQIKSKLR
jgi:hypothetical protein